MADGAVCMLTGGGASSRIVYHALVKRGFRVERVVVEEGRAPARFLRRRVKKLGLPTVVGQVLFRAAVVPSLRLASRRRIAELERSLALDDSPFDPGVTTRVESVNSQETIRALQAAAPRAVVVNGTRIISGEVLGCVPVPFLNTHAGITPTYRGVHGGYWALAESRPDLCGVTVHLVDRGIDTGNILGQALITPTPEDNFVTYPLLQLAAGLPLLAQALEDVLEGRCRPRAPPPGAVSRLRSHPTIWQYAWDRLRRGVK